MRRLLIGVIAAAALGGCAYGPGYGPGPGPVAFDAYYDGSYGAFDDGYWGDDGGFWYRTGADHHYERDNANHFSRVAANGMNGIHMRGDVDHTGAPHFAGGGGHGGGDHGGGDHGGGDHGPH